MTPEEAVHAELTRIGTTLESAYKAKEIVERAGELGQDAAVVAIGAAFYKALFVMKQSGNEARALELERSALYLGRVASGDLVP